jgi:hypothetical protein
MLVDEILIEAAIKNIYLSKIPDWENELLAKAPPVLWFGNSKSDKDKIVTIWANPSRWEFLDQKEMKPISEPYLKTHYERYYLKKTRFYHIPSSQNYEHILSVRELRELIVESFDNYFINEPYKWFGKKKHDSYNAEGLLRGFGASYFEIDTLLRACHIDFFPFATISDFTKIKAITFRDVFANNWASSIVNQILHYLKPKYILIFGKTNFEYFAEYFGGILIGKSNWVSRTGKGKCNIWLANYNNIEVIGLSVNLGNPKGFDASGLQELGRHLYNLTSP